MQNRLAAGGSLLPQRYRRLLIKAQSSLRYEEFDFSYYNKTRFAGLENDLPNCYCNALLQVRVLGVAEFFRVLYGSRPLGMVLGLQMFGLCTGLEVSAGFWGCEQVVWLCCLCPLGE